MPNQDSKQSNNSNTKANLPTNVKKPEPPINTVFTLNDGINLLQLTKNFSNKNSKKIPNLKFFSNEKQKINEQFYKNHRQNILSINPIKGKSIFNNSILDNVLGTINPNGELIAGNKSPLEREKIVINRSDNFNKESNSRLSISKTSIINSKNKFNYEKVSGKNLNLLHSNIQEQEEIKNLKFNKEKDNQEFSELINNKILESSNKHIGGNLNKIPFEENHKYKLKSDNNLRFSYEKLNANNREIKHINYFKDSNIKKINSNWTINQDVNSNNLQSFAFKNKNYSNTYISNEKNCNNNCNNIINFSDSIQDNIEIQAQMHNKELKFELYKQNKLLEPQKAIIKKFCDINFLFKSKINNVSNINNNPNKKNSNLNLKINLNCLSSPNEFYTQTKNNYSLILDEKNTTKHTEGENLLSSAGKENSNKNHSENDENLNLKEMKLNNQNENNKENIINNKDLTETILEYSSRTGSHFYNNDNNNYKNNNYKINNYNCTQNKVENGKLNGYHLLTRHDNNLHCNPTQKNSFDDIKRSNLFSQIQLANENSNYENICNSTFLKLTSTNCLINSKINIHDFNKEMFHNSKILRENLIAKFKTKKKNDNKNNFNNYNPIGNKNLKIKFSNVVKMYV